jgi:hypothetical protein
MIKLLCVNKSIIPHWKHHMDLLTIGEVYEGIETYHYYEIFFNVNLCFPKWCFINIAEWREQQIKSILDD